MTSARRIEDRVRSVRTTTSAATDDRIMALGEAAMAKRNERHTALPARGAAIGRIIMKSNWIKLATIAAIIVAIGLGMFPIAATDVKRGADGDIQLNVEFKYPKTGPADIYEAGAPKTAKITPSPEQ